MKQRLAPIVVGSALALSLFTFVAYDRVQSGIAGNQNIVLADDVAIGMLSAPTGAVLLGYDLAR